MRHDRTFCGERSEPMALGLMTALA